MIDSPEIVIRSQKELDKLLDDNYNSLDKVAVVANNISLDSSRTTYWKKSTAFFKYAIECRNINAGLMNIESNSEITAHDIRAWRINCTNIRAHDIDCKYLKARTVYAHTIKAQHIYSDSVWIRNMPTLFYSYNYWDTNRFYA